MRRFLITIFFGALSIGLFANSPVNFGLNFRVNMPRTTYESTDWDNFFNEVSSDNTVSSYSSVVDESEMGYAGGVFLRLNGQGKGFIHSEAMFSFNSTGMSTSTQDEIIVETVTFTSESASLNVPIYYGRNLVCTPIFKVRAFTGPSFEWDLKSTTSAKRDGVDVSNVDNEVDLDNFDWSWAVGAGVEVFMFSLDARYCFNLKGVDGSAGAQNSFSQKTNMVEFTLGFKLF